MIDSHTAGEPTRVIVGGVPDPVGRTMAEKRRSFSEELDWVRTTTVCEPRGHDALVGALLCEPCENDCIAGVIFFNNVGVLHGCLHGTMGIVATLHHLGEIGPGSYRIDTPTGVVTATLGKDRSTVEVGNVRSYRHATGVEVSVPGWGEVRGDVAWGGNWFFLTNAPEGLEVCPSHIEDLTEFAWNVRMALREAGITGEGGEEIDHIEVFAPPIDLEKADSRNFVLCPGKAYDRSPCGTGTSAKLACLAADGSLVPGQVWRQAGILNSVFSGTIKPAPNSAGGGVFPTVTGQAFITGEASLITDSNDPFSMGIPSGVERVSAPDQVLNPAEI